MIPVYLFAKQPGELVLEHGSLEFRHPGKAPRLLPLRQISSLVLSGPLVVQTEALLHCAGCGIDITFLDGAGRAMARLEALEPSPSRLARRLESLCLQPDWGVRYEAWVVAMERQTILRALRGRSITLEELRNPGRLRASIEERLDAQFGHEAVNAVSTRLVGCLRAMVQAELSRSKLATATSPCIANAPALGRDLLRVMRWHLEGVRNGELLARARWERRHQRVARPVGDRHLLDLFEQERPRLEREVGHLLGRFEQWLDEEAA